MVTKKADELSRLTNEILRATGASKQHADIVAEHLILANLRGVDSHGVWHIPRYVKAIRAGEINLKSEPAIVEETSLRTLVRGGWAFGHVVARFGMEIAIKKAKDLEVAVVSVGQTHHIGRLGHYSEMAAAEGMISMVWAGGQGAEKPAAVPYGGSKPIFHTNPIAIGLPTGREVPIIVDFATSATAGVKVINAYNRNEKLALNCIVDKDGNSTTDPKDFMEGGAHLPFGGHKGYALMLVTEFLGRIFSGADDGAKCDYSEPLFRRHGVTMMVFRADLFQPFSIYAQRADKMVQCIREVPPAPGFREVLLPGIPEDRAQAYRQENGIPIADDIWDAIGETALSLGVTV